MNDLRDHFASCFQPPHDAAGSRVTFYFSLNTRGREIGEPRTTWLGFKGSEADRIRGLSDFESGFRKCLPLSMSGELAATIPGKVYYLQYVVADSGRTSEVLLRPFGSHYFGGGAALVGAVPVMRQTIQPPIAAPEEGVRAPFIRRFRSPFRFVPLFRNRAAFAARSPRPLLGPRRVR